MAPTKRPPVQPLPLELRMQREDAFIKLEERIEKGRQLKNQEIGSPDEYIALKAERSKWSDYNHELLKQMFTTDEAASEYSFWGVAGGTVNASWQTRLEELREDIELSVHRLESIQERLEIIPVSPLTTNTQLAIASDRLANESKQVFLAHGRDEAAREKVARFLRRLLGSEPTILHEQPNQGRTIIEKLEHHSKVGFAIVLLTPDDEGRMAGSDEHLSLRARQNVILELGYFVGLLGRDRVCALYGAGVEIPSDFLGVAYVPLDDGDGWQLRLAREFKAAKFAVNLNEIV